MSSRSAAKKLGHKTVKPQSSGKQAKAPAKIVKMAPAKAKPAQAAKVLPAARPAALEKKAVAAPAQVQRPLMGAPAPRPQVAPARPPAAAAGKQPAPAKAPAAAASKASAPALVKQAAPSPVRPSPIAAPKGAPPAAKSAAPTSGASKSAAPPARAGVPPLQQPAQRRPMPAPMGSSQPLRAQPPKQSLARSFYWSELRLGDDLPPLSKVAVDRVQMARYAAASGDFNRLHLDEPFAHSVGFPGTFAPGMLAMGFIGQLLTSWLRRGHVRRLSARFVKIVWPGDELTCRGRISELKKEAGGCYADVELWAENQKGELVLRGQATCELYESPSTGGGDGGGLLFGPTQGTGRLTAGPKLPDPKALERLPADAKGARPVPAPLPPKKK